MVCFYDLGSLRSVDVSPPKDHERLPTVKPEKKNETRTHTQADWALSSQLAQLEVSSARRTVRIYPKTQQRQQRPKGPALSAPDSFGFVLFLFFSSSLSVHILFEKILLFFLSSYLLSSLSFRSFLVQSRYGELTQTFRFFPFFSFVYIFRILSLMECCLSSACLIERPGLLLTRFIAAIWQNDETAPRDAISTIRNVSHTEPFYLLVDIYKAHKRPNDRPGRFNHHQEVRGSPTIA